jgi:hypothetical protein
MAIGTGTALLGSALIGGAAAASSGNRAARAQQQASDQATQAQLQMFNTARNDMAPWRATGQRALGSLESLMGMTPANQPAQMGAQQGNPQAVAPGGAMQGGGAMLPLSSVAPWMAPANNANVSTLGGDTTLNVHNQQDGGLTGSYAGAYTGDGVGAPPMVQGGQPTAQEGGQGGGFDQFLNSINYNFLRQEGENALSRMLARSGHLGSGRGLRGAMDLNQNMAHSNAIMPYMNQLNSMAGLGQNASAIGGNQAMQMGGMMGQNLMNAGNARASAYQNTGNAISNMFNQAGMWYGMRNSGMFGGGP